MPVNYTAVFIFKIRLCFKFWKSTMREDYLSDLTYRNVIYEPMKTGCWIRLGWRTVQIDRSSNTFTFLFIFNIKRLQSDIQRSL